MFAVVASASVVSAASSCGDRDYHSQTTQLYRLILVLNCNHKQHHIAVPVKTNCTLSFCQVCTTFPLQSFLFTVCLLQSRSSKPGVGIIPSCVCYISSVRLLVWKVYESFMKLLWKVSIPSSSATTTGGTHWCVRLYFKTKKETDEEEEEEKRIIISEWQTHEMNIIYFLPFCSSRLRRLRDYLLCPLSRNAMSSLCVYSVSVFPFFIRMCVQYLTAWDRRR